MQLAAAAQNSAIDSLAVYHAATARHSGLISQELIYLHLDNNSYYRGDRIFFACYLVTSGRMKPSDLSQTVYVELLNPNGKIIDRCVLKATEGRCHGSLLADETPFYSGYYEIRAYTRYMLNFGPEAVYSRVVPVYVAPKIDGDWSDRTILRHDFKNLPMQRPKQSKAPKSGRMDFYPEGGRMVDGLPARLAYELTDGAGHPLANINGRIVDLTDNSTVATFQTGHIGRGVIDFTPTASTGYAAELTINGKFHRFDLPEVSANGVALRVNSLKDPNSIEVTVCRTPDCLTRAVGVSLTCRSELYGRTIVDLSEQQSATFEMSTLKIPSGVAQLTLFNAAGEPIADRLFFHNRNDFINIRHSFNKTDYQPFEPVDLEVNLADSRSGAPVTTPLSISITDADTNMPSGANIMTDLLLCSEIKGYVHNPAYYFEQGREADLDNLLLVQGWRRYSWSQLAGMEPLRIDSMPEQGIEVRGQILERLRNKPKASIAVSAMLSRTDTTGVIRTYTFTTDANGRFMFRDSIAGNWMAIISSSNKNKVSGNRILLDLSERPEPRAYTAAELTAAIPMAINSAPDSAGGLQSDSVLRVINGMRTIKEVEVKAKYTAAQEMAEYMESSVAAYDMMKEVNSLRDKGKRRLRTLADVMPQIDPKFHIGIHDSLYYDGKKTLIIADPNFGDNKEALEEIMGVNDIITTADGELSMESPYLGNMSTDYIKNVYVNTGQSALVACASRIAQRTSVSPMDILKKISREYGSVLFIEFYPDKRAAMKTGVRRDIIEGYTTGNVEFYSPDYSAMPPVEPDHRRTLYWNPELRPDSTGTARVRFYNNSSARSFQVDAAALSSSGRLSK